MKFASYTIRSRIASGGTAEVYLGRDAGDRVVAVKILHPHLSDDEEFVRMFLTEGRLAGLLRHPNITRAYEVGSVDGRLFIAMEAIDGPPLAALLADTNATPWPFQRAMAVMKPVLRALHYAHELKDSFANPLGVVHRDVTPENILMSRAGVIKVTDFGSAKSGLSAVRTRTGILKGRFAYMSPEQARGRPIDRRSDVFSAGLVLYELLAGRPAYDAADNHALLEMAAAARIAPLALAVPGINTAVLHALDASAEARFATAQEFLSALEAAAPLDAEPGQAELEGLIDAWVARHPLPPEPPPERPPASPTPARRPQVVLGAAMLALALVLASALIVLGPWRAPGAAIPSSAPVANAQELAAAGWPKNAPTPASAPSALPLPPPQPAPYGRITVNTLPWSKVLIDGREVAAMTPLIGQRLAAGRHSVTLICTNGKRATFAVDVHEGETISRFLDMASDTPQ